MNMHRAIAKSCNTYFYTMGRRIGIERFSAMAKRLGLGQRFDLPVVSQSYGTIPDPAWKQRRYRQDWSQSDTLNAAIGQGYVILNPLQLAVMAARIASGRDVQPRLLLRAPAARRAPLPFAADQLRGGARGHGRGGQRQRHRRRAAACPSPTSRWPARPAPRRSATSAPSAAAPAPPGAIATTACSSSSRRSARRATPARW